ncbi:MAG: SRPBCC domain-containing protein [Acidimicrobiia bacterium]|nr:SRPBCC domain-containing protein [Acidimicrobiia bacterium]
MSAGTHHLEVSRLIHAAQDAVFAAWTDPDKIVQWWGAGGVICTEAAIDLAVGGRYRFANLTPDGETMWITGVFTVVDPPSRLEYTWATEPVDAHSDYSKVVVTFSSERGGTLVTIAHTQILTHEAREMNHFGWVGCLEGLEALVGARDA